MGCMDEINGTMSCNHLLTKVIESKFTNKITDGWGVTTPTLPTSYTPDYHFPMVVRITTTKAKTENEEVRKL